jgi:hypothetical protein
MELLHTWVSKIEPALAYIFALWLFRFYFASLFSNRSIGWSGMSQILSGLNMTTYRAYNSKLAC